MQYTNSQDLARKFNEDEAVWRAYERRKTMRKILGLQDPLSEDCLGNLDRLEAEREARPVRGTGILVP